MQTNVSIEEEKETTKPSIFGMITSPTLQFERMKEKAPIGLPLIFVLLIMTVATTLVAYVSLDNPILNDPELTGGMEIPVGVTLGMAAGGALIGGLISFYIIAGFYKVAMMIMGNDTNYKKLLSLVIFSSMISTLGALVNGLIAFAVGGYEPNYTSLAPIFSDNPLLRSIGTNFDIFNIWYYVVLGLGLQTVAGLSKTKAITLVIIVFLLGVGISSLSGLFAIPGM